MACQIDIWPQQSFSTDSVWLKLTLYSVLGHFEGAAAVHVSQLHIIDCCCTTRQYPLARMLQSFVIRIV